MTIDDIMALAASCYSRIDPEPQWKLRQAIEQALLQAHKAGFDAALLPGSVPDAQPVECCIHGIHMMNACGKCVPPRGTK